MKTVQIVLGGELLHRIDRAAKRRGLSRSAFIRDSLEQQLDAGEIDALAAEERKVWGRQPLSADEKAGLRALSKAQERVIREVARRERW